MITIQLESWAAMAPGLDSKEAWLQWLKQPDTIPETLGVLPLKEIPPLLRRRFSALGKCAMGATLQLLEEETQLPSIFASRHGDTGLTLSLLNEMGRDEPMSPTGFSLAVHNAVSGLYTIARKDTSAVTAIAAIEGLTLQTLFEVAGQLQESEKVLCVLYDVPLPDIYRRYAVGENFPYAIAMIFSRTGKTSLCIEPMDTPDILEAHPSHSEPIRLISLLAGISDTMRLTVNGAHWRITRAIAE
ncbi:beta-ketoacyl synthase chain length factor [Neptunomonas antarctica]|uniref:Beta-ketoacyl synthase, N-terminal domain n=1 Tax=Neptunomonas antarctica TaxID=619304 RepID=A0A1N7IT79_9GAMM|nr:beta-ketoacyl synthase chain length factor [Neptunomonas antarctica]SIS40305.1 Beta-ketoacyl synthase, N-terminal domain [Neptunomonas antarctica]